MKSPKHGLRSSALAALVLALIALGWSAAAVAEPGASSAAAITGSFSDRCRDFTARSSKDISHVELHYTDGRIVKDESTTTPDYAIDGAAGDEIDVAIVKSGTTTETFTCPATNNPPTAVLEIKSPPVERCTLNSTEQTLCAAWEPRTDWSSPQPDRIFGFVYSDPSQLPLTLEFRGTSSTDPDDDIVSWSIDFGDGTSLGGSWTTEPPTAIEHVPCAGCAATVTLTVTDSAGQSDTDAFVLALVDGTPD